MKTTLSHVHFDSDAYPREQRFALWRQAISGTYDVELVDSDPLDFKALVDVWIVGDMLLTHSHVPAVRFTRTLQIIKQDQGDYYLFFYLINGSSDGDFDGRRAIGTPGSITAIDLSRPFSSTGSMPSENISISIPRAVIDRAVRAAPDLHGVLLDGPLGLLLGDHIASVVNILPTLKEDDAAGVSQATVQVIASSVAASTHTGRVPGSLLSFATRREIERFVDQNLHDAELGPERICDALGISRSNAYRAFAGTEGIADYVQKRRLLAARNLLAHPDEHRPIAEIAEAVGIANAAHFSRAFRRTFGFSPRNARSAMAADRPPITVSNVIHARHFAAWINDLQKHFTMDPADED